MTSSVFYNRENNIGIRMRAMEYIKLTKENIDAEHICCVMKDKRGEYCVETKKAWLRERLEEGLVFLKANVRGKVFIEYLPAEKAWCPIVAEDYLYINCLWVAGQFKGQGIGSALLESCIEDAKLQQKKGVVVLSSKGKMPFLSDGNFLKHKGFKVVDTALECYELLTLPLVQDAELPYFKPCAKQGKIDEGGMVLYYSNQCPYAEKYAHIIAQMAIDRGFRMQLKKIGSYAAAQKMPIPITMYGLFDEGHLLTHEILSEKKFEALLARK